MAQRDDPGDPRVLSGEAWSAFCQELEAAGRTILRPDMPGTPRDRAEGFRYLTRLLRASLLTRLEGMDADHPRLLTCIDDTQKYGLENPDGLYQQARLRGDASYRVSGQRGSVRYLGFQITGGVFGYDDPFSVRSHTHAGEMQIAADGSFELILSPRPHPGNWLRLDDHSKALLVRQFFSDWEREVPAELSIERIDGEGDPPLLTSAQLARRLQAASSWVGKTADFWCDFVLARKLRGVNVLHPPTRAGGGPVGDDFDFTGGTGAAENRYGEGHFVLEPDEALYFEVTPPRCHYWGFQLGSVWFESLDYANHLTSLNDSQAWIGPDGVFRCCVAHRDPGVPNWLSTTGLREGLILYRWQLAESGPTPVTRLVKQRELAGCFPPDTPRIGPGERRAQIVRRRAHVARRFR